MRDRAPLPVSDALEVFALAVRRRWAFEESLRQTFFDLVAPAVPGPIPTAYPDATRAATSFPKWSRYERRAQDTIELKAVMAAERHWYYVLTESIDHALEQARLDDTTSNTEISAETYVLQLLDAKIQQLTDAGVDASIAEAWLFPGGRHGVRSVLGRQARERYDALGPGSVETPPDNGAPVQQEQALQRLLYQHILIPGDELPSLPEAAWRHVEAMWMRSSAQKPPRQRTLTAPSGTLTHTLVNRKSTAVDREARLIRQMELLLKAARVELMMTISIVTAEGVNVAGEALLQQLGLASHNALIRALAPVIPVSVAVTGATFLGGLRLVNKATAAAEARLAALHEISTLADLVSTINRHRELEGLYRLNIFSSSHRATMRRTLVAAGLPENLVRTILSGRIVRGYAEALRAAPAPNDPVATSLRSFESVGMHRAVSELRSAFDHSYDRSLATVVGARDAEVTTLLSGAAGPHPGVAGRAVAATRRSVIERTIHELSDIEVLPALAAVAAAAPAVDRALGALPTVAARVAVVAAESGQPTPTADMALTTELSRNDGRGAEALRFLSARTRAQVERAPSGRASHRRAQRVGHYICQRQRASSLRPVGPPPDRRLSWRVSTSAVSRTEPAALSRKHPGYAERGDLLRQTLADAMTIQKHHAAVERALAKEISALSPEHRARFGRSFRGRKDRGCAPSPAVETAIDRDDPPATGAIPPSGPHHPQPKPQQGPAGNAPPQPPDSPTTGQRQLEQRVIRSRIGRRPGRRHGPPSSSAPPSRTTTGRASTRTSGTSRHVVDGVQRQESGRKSPAPHTRQVAGRRVIAKAALQRKESVAPASARTPQRAVAHPSHDPRRTGQPPTIPTTSALPAGDRGQQNRPERPSPATSSPATSSPATSSPATNHGRATPTSPTGRPAANAPTRQRRIAGRMPLPVRPALGRAALPGPGTPSPSGPG